MREYLSRIRRLKPVIGTMGRKAPFDGEFVLFLNTEKRTTSFKLQDFSKARRWPLQELAGFLWLLISEPER